MFDWQKSALKVIICAYAMFFFIYFFYSGLFIWRNQIQTQIPQP